jgi:ribonucleoside-diphosphate reductase alpha chain
VVDVYATLNRYPDGRPGEVLMTVGKQGAIAHGFCEALGIVISISLQHGVPLQAFTSKLRATQFEPAGFTKDPEFPVATSILDLVSRWAIARFGGES